MKIVDGETPSSRVWCGSQGTSLLAVSEAGHKFGRRRVAKSIMFTGATRLTNNTAEMSTIH